MGYQRPTQRDLAAARKLERQKDMNRAIAEGRPTVRAMTADERAQSDAPLGGRGVRARRTSQAVAVPLTPACAGHAASD